MTIIVTGGAGFIGSNFVFHMLKAHPDYRIVCLDKLTYAGNLSTLEPVMDNPNFRFVKLDICDREGVYKLFEEEKPDIVVNFAAESHVDRSIENPEIFLQTNILGTAVMMDACRKYGIQRYHQVSTDEVYGDLPLDRPDLFCTGLSQNLWSPGNGFQMLQQLRPVSLPGKADSADDRQCPGRQAAAGLRQGRKCA